ncbi:MAG: patatin-like phospholipase family protein, partial [Ginsengibacter sp.]
MNPISDLAARAISFITAIQTTLLNGEIYLEKETDKVSILTISPGDFESKFRSLIYKDMSKDKFDDRAKELVWISSKKLDKPQAIEYTVKICVKLVKWINDNRPNGISKLQETYGRYPTPYNWRMVIEAILYEKSWQCLSLATAIEYLPIQIILALGGGVYDAGEQRILQMWGTSNDDKAVLLTEEEIKISGKFKDLEKTSGTSAVLLLQDHTALIDQLINHKNVPLSFELVFIQELKEIEVNRIRRQEEEFVTGLEELSDVAPKVEEVDINDPFEKVKQMGVCALAFSGGGIRSATFNLGILQGLARKKLIGKFDYLSTVSGGGYIGSWLATWIKKEESVVKVSNRLCPDKSPDPAGLELTPIKWLRMFSNYFAPNASIMSVDSWTFGMTWLRNTLLNQIVIFLLLLSVLFGGNLLFLFWADHLMINLDPSRLEVLGFSILLLTPVALLAGMGMHAYREDTPPRMNIRRDNTNKISTAIIAISIIGAYIISAWLSSGFNKTGVPSLSIYDKIIFFWPAAVVAFFCLLIVAFLGNYMDNIKNYQHNKVSSFIILFSITLFSAIFGLICLALVADLLEKMPDTSIGLIPINKKLLQFIFGVPLTLEVFSFTVIARMGLLGKYFPDERREWWGRIGAYIHRISFLWVLVSSSALLGWTFLQHAFHEWAAPSIAATGGWIALVASCVKAAFSSKTAGKGNEKGVLPTFLNILSKVGPYLFILGLLILLPALTRPLLFLEKGVFIDLGYSLPVDEIQNLLIIIFCAAAAYL